MTQPLEIPCEPRKAALGQRTDAGELPLTVNEGGLFATVFLTDAEADKLEAELHEERAKRD